MKYIEEKLEFVQNIPGSGNKSLREYYISSPVDTESTQILGIKVRLGNLPIVYNHREILESVHTSLPPNIQLLFKDVEIYSIVHAIGITRLKGKATVEEVHYTAEMVDDKGKVMQDAQTRDLIPHTRFKEVFSVSSNFKGVLSISGNAEVSIPGEITQHLLPEYISIGGAMSLQLSNSNSFMGQFTYKLKFPVVISTGIATNTCHWVLWPNEDHNPLLRDQLLVQVVAVKKDISSLNYKIQGSVKVDKGLFYKAQIQKTREYTIQVPLK